MNSEWRPDLIHRMLSGGRDLIKDVFGFVRSDESLREQIEPPDLGPTVKANFNSGLPVGTVIPAPAHGTLR